MKKLLFFLFLSLMTLLNAQNNSIQLIPQPVNMIQSTGSFLLTNTTTVSYNQAESRTIADMLIQRLNVPTGFSLKAQQGKTGIIQLNLNTSTNAELGKEGYILEATTKGVVISANQTAGERRANLRGIRRDNAVPHPRVGRWLCSSSSCSLRWSRC